MLSATLDAQPISQDQVVYVSTEFTHNEIPLCGIRLQLHCMQPLAERHRDTECIIDRKPKVEQVEAVNPEIMQEVAVGRDSAAWNVTIQCNNVRNNVKGGQHRTRDAGGPAVIPSSLVCDLRTIGGGQRVRNAGSSHVNAGAHVPTWATLT